MIKALSAQANPLPSYGFELDPPKYPTLLGPQADRASPITHRGGLLFAFQGKAVRFFPPCASLWLIYYTPFRSRKHPFPIVWDKPWQARATAPVHDLQIAIANRRADQTGTVMASYSNSQSKSVLPLSGGYSRAM